MLLLPMCIGIVLERTALVCGDASSLGFAATMTTNGDEDGVGATETKAVTLNFFPCGRIVTRGIAFLLVAVTITIAVSYAAGEIGTDVVAVTAAVSVALVILLLFRNCCSSSSDHDSSDLGTQCAQGPDQVEDKDDWDELRSDLGTPMDDIVATRSL